MESLRQDNRILAVVDDDRAPRRIELRRELPPKMLAQAVGVFAQALADALQREEAALEAAPVPGTSDPLKLALATAASTPDLDGPAKSAAKTNNQGRTGRDATVANARYGGHPEAIELIQWIASKVEVFEHQKHNLSEESVARSRAEIRETSDNALDQLRYFGGSSSSNKSERIGLLMLVLRTHAQRVLPDGTKVVADVVDAADADRWWSLSDKERQGIIERGDNFTFRWIPNSPGDIARSLDEQVAAVISHHPDLNRYFTSIDSEVRARNPQRFDEQRAGVRDQIRAALRAFRKPREPNPGTASLARLRDERRLHEIWDLPLVETLSRDDEARLLLPIANAIGLPADVRKGSDDIHSAGLESMKRAIQRGIEARETHAGKEPDQKGCLHELPTTPRRGRASTTTRVLDAERKADEIGVHGSRRHSSSAPRQGAAADRTIRPSRGR